MEFKIVNLKSIVNPFVNFNLYFYYKHKYTLWALRCAFR